MRFNGQTDRREGGGGTGEWQTDTATNGNENGGKWENKGRRIANGTEQNRTVHQQK